MSLDGYIACLDQRLDWLDQVRKENEDYGFQVFFESIDALLLGRKTYEAAANAPVWPYLNKRVFVLSNTLTCVKKEAELIHGDLTQLISKMFLEGIKHLWINGGLTVSQFLNQQMVDKITLCIVPIILGSGIPLFNQIQRLSLMRLISSHSYPSGLVKLCYEFQSKVEIHFKMIAYESDEYYQCVALREEILRKPFGFLFSSKELAVEKDYLHVAGYLDEELCATAMLVPKKEELKMMRVAIKRYLQNMGIGSQLLHYCEKYALNNGFKSIYCYARESAIPFYLKYNFNLIGDPFDSLGISHCKMQKILIG